MGTAARQPMDGKDVRALRKFYGVSAVTFAGSIGISAPMVFAIEKGTTKPSEQTQRGLTRLALMRDMIEVARADGTWQAREEHFFVTLDNRPERGIEFALHKALPGEMFGEYELQANINRIRGNGGKVDMIPVTLRVREQRQYWQMTEPCAVCGETHEWGAGFPAGVRQKQLPKVGLVDVPADDPLPFLKTYALHKGFIELVELTTINKG